MHVAHCDTPRGASSAVDAHLPLPVAHFSGLLASCNPSAHHCCTSFGDCIVWNTTYFKLPLDYLDWNADCFEFPADCLVRRGDYFAGGSDHFV